MKQKLCLMLVIFCLGIWSVTLSAHTPLGGLTVAVSPDGTTIVAGGDSRVLYVLDAGSLEVRQHVWLKTTIWGLTFNQDGSKLLVEDTSSTVYMLNTSDWTVVQEFKDSASLSPAASADRCAVQGKNNEILFLSMTTGEVQGKVSVGQKIAAFGLNAAGSQLAVIHEEQKDESEPTVKSGDVPKDLKGAARTEFELQNDGKTAMFQMFEVPSGAELLAHKIFYTTREAVVFFDGEAVIVANYGNKNARIEPSGAIQIFELQNSFNYGIGVSADQTLMGSGGLSNGTYTTVAGPDMVPFTTEKLPGWPEYFKGFAFDANGNAYGATTAFRIFKFAPDGSVLTSVPVY